MKRLLFLSAFAMAASVSFRRDQQPGEENEKVGPVPDPGADTFSGGGNVQPIEQQQTSDPESLEGTVQPGNHTATQVLPTEENATQSTGFESSAAPAPSDSEGGE